MHRGRRLLVTCLCAAVLIGGCWDGRELEKRAIVLLVGIDRTEAGVRLSLQLARPQAFPGSAVREAPAGEVVTVLSREGTDVDTALLDLQLAVDRQLFFGHTRVVVMSEDAAREGVWRYLHPLFGDTLLPRTAWLFIARGSARAVLAHRPALDPIPATYLTHFFDNRILLQRWFEVTIGGFHQRWVTPGVEPLVVWIAPGQPDQSAPTILGLAAFLADRFAGGLDRESSRGWVMTQNQLPAGRVPAACPDRPGTFAVRVVRTQTRIRPRIQDDALKGLEMVTQVQGRIEGVDCTATFSDPREMERFEQAFQQEISRLIRAGLRRAQTELRSDVFGLGRAVYRYAHQAWPGDRRWAELFPQVPVEVDVRVRLDHTRSYRDVRR